MTPFVSVIMPVRNESGFIAQCLKAVVSQTYPAEAMEIVVADGMSTDSTRKIIEQIRQTTRIPIKIVDNPGRIAPTGLNRALESARGEIMVRVDGHCEIEPDYVENCVKYLQAGKAEGVGGPIETVGETSLAKTIATAMSSPFGVGNSAFRTVNDRELYVDTVAFPGYSRGIVEKAGKFNEELVRNQDDEYNYRIRKMGGRILLAPDIRSRYYSRSTLKSLWRQYFQYGFWKIRVLQLHPAQMSARQFVPFLFVLSLLAAALLAIFDNSGLLLFAAVSLTYAVANLAASLLLTKGNLAKAPLLPLCFAILHFSYGLGFLFGLLYFINRWGDKNAPELFTSKT
jgi:succinoglycan biosynthesis protein ExoA